jgi:hypothetical protein
MHGGFCNFNAGTLGKSMVEGRISAGVVVDDGSDVGGGASIMGTLSGGGKEVIRVGKKCLLGANSGLGISLGDNCTLEAGLYVTAGTKVLLPDGTIAKARELSGRSDLQFRRNSQTGAVEVIFKGECALASQIVVHGDGRNYCTALVTLDPDSLSSWAQHRGIAGDYAVLSQHPDVHAEVASAIKAVNAKINRWETVKDFRILDHDLTIEAGELTPSLKVKRRVVEDKHRDLLDAMYSRG